MGRQLVQQQRLPRELHWYVSSYRRAPSTIVLTHGAPDYVNYNPSAFEDAYWDFAAVRIYQPSNSTSGASSLTQSAGGGAALLSSAISLIAGFGAWFL